MIKEVFSNDFNMIYVASCGEGINAYNLVQSTLVQFPGNEITVVKMPHIRTHSQVDDLMQRVMDTDSLVVHTIVNSDLRQYITRRGMSLGTVTIDLMGPVISKIQTFLDKAPIEQPGLYRKIHQVDLKQVSAIDYALAHDDGLHPEDLPDAEIILIGLSRAGKTPLSMYLAVLGWKVANVPYVPSIPMPDTLSGIDKRRVIGLDINTRQLMAHRKMRQQDLGTSDIYCYSSRDGVEKEIASVRRYFVSNGFSMVDVSNKPIETSADEILEMITRRFKQKAHKT